MSQAGGAGGKIGDLFVQFGQRGKEDLEAGIAAVGRQMGELASKVRNVGEAMALSFSQLSLSSKALQGHMGQVNQLAQTASSLAPIMGRGLGVALAGASHAAQGLAGAMSGIVGPLQGMVMAGIQASSMGQVLSMQFAELNRQLASLFIPTINAFSQKLAQLIEWFRGLTGQQQAAYRTLGLLLAGLTLAGTILPRIIASFQMLQTVLIGVRAAMLGMALANPFTWIVGGVALLVLAMTDLKTVGNAMASFAAGLGTIFRDLGRELRGVAEQLRDLDAPTHNLKKGLYGGWEMNLPERKSFWSDYHTGTDLGEQAGKKLGMSDKTGKSWGAGLGLTHLALPFGLGSLAGSINRALGLRGEAAAGDESRKELAPRPGAIEDTQATWKRLAMASRHVGIEKDKSEAEKTNEWLGKLFEDLGKVVAKMNDVRPPVSN